MSPSKLVPVESKCDASREMTMEESDDRRCDQESVSDHGEDIQEENEDMPEEGDPPSKKKRRGGNGAPVQLPYMKDLPEEERRARVADLARTRNQIFRELRKNHALEVSGLNSRLEQQRITMEALQREVDDLRPKAVMCERLQTKVLNLYNENRSLNKRYVDALERLMNSDPDVPLVQYTDN